MGETLKLTVKQVREITTGLNSLDGIRKSKDEIDPYEFEDGVQWNISKNAVIFERANEPYDHAVKALMVTHKIVQGEQITVDNRERFIALQAAVEALDDKEIEVSGVLLLTMAELRTKPSRGDKKQDKNLIPIGVIKKLNPIIKEA
jgi:hypothetical protein